MSYGFLSFPIWISMCVLLSALLIYIGIKRRRVDRKALLITYFIIATETLLVALSRLIEEVFVQFMQFNNYISNAIIGLLVIFVLNLIYMGITNNGDERSKKLFKIALLLTVLSVVPLGIWILID